MSDVPAFILAFVICVALGWVAFHFIKLRHAARQSSPTAPAPLVGFERRGTDTALHDTCALLWGLPAYGETPTAGDDRLRAAIHDDQNNQQGEQ